MSGLKTIGRLKQLDDQGELWLQPGDFGKGRDGVWYGRPPKGHAGSLAEHQVQEHADGTITVQPSIKITTADEGGQEIWHGYLEAGVWREC